MKNINKVSLALIFMITSVVLFFNSLAYTPNLIEPVQVQCVSASLASAHMVSKVHTEGINITDQNLLLSTWDLSSIQDDQIDKSYLYLKKQLEMNSSFSTAKLSVLNLQGLPVNSIEILTRLVSDFGGCWAYTPLWETPRGLARLHFIKQAVNSILLGQQEAQESMDHGLLTLILGDLSQTNVKAERWALPPRPARWPKRLFHRQPAILAIELAQKKESIEHTIRANSKPKKLQILHIKLADTTHKHQAGAFALQALKRSPFKERIDPPWLLLGDWRVNPPFSPVHAQVDYRFQRFSIEALSETYVALVPNQAHPFEWGRWRLGKGYFGQSRRLNDQERIPSVIDLAYASQGKLEALSLTNSELLWLGNEQEERAPLFFNWTLINKVYKESAN